MPAQYAALAMLGVFPLEELPTLKKLGAGCRATRPCTARRASRAAPARWARGSPTPTAWRWRALITGRDYRVYCLLGDGELHEGQVWEAAMTAGHRCLSNVTAIVDRNGLKAMDATKCGKLTGAAGRALGSPLAGPPARSTATTWPRSATRWIGPPGPRRARRSIIAHTVKGKGVSFMENQAGFHNAADHREQYARGAGRGQGRSCARWEGSPA